MALPPLTAAELEQQRKAGAHFRSLVQDATDALLKESKRPAILLSGGVDSTSALWCMIAAGAKPLVLTYRCPGVKPSSDERKAEALAKHHGLEFEVVVLNDNPDMVAKQLEQIVIDYPLLSSRADFEVGFILDSMYAVAQQRGCDAVFSGISDRNVHLLNRKMEIQAKTSGMPLPEADMRRILFLDDGQMPPYTAMAVKRGLVLAASIHLATGMLPYNGIEWRVMNLTEGIAKDGRTGKALNKAITMSAFQDEIKATDVVVKAQPMQTGDSGARDYFDNALKASEWAHARVGRKLDSALMYYNSLLSIHRQAGGRKRRYNQGWEDFRYVVSGIEPDTKGYVSRYPKDEDGRAIPPAGLAGVVDDEADDLFGDIEVSDAKPVVLGADGKPDGRVDCFGFAFWEGDQTMNGCLRAQMGLCGTYRPEVPYDLYACEAFHAWSGDAVDEMNNIAAQYESAGLNGAARVYSSWAERMRERFDAMKRDYSEILGGHGDTLC